MKGNNPLLIPMLYGWERYKIHCQNHIVYKFVLWCYFYNVNFIEFSPMIFFRQIAKQRPSYKKVIFYRTPCARRLRNLNEVEEYLQTTDSQLTIDLFCFDFNLHTDSEFVPIKVIMSDF